MYGNGRGREPFRLRRDPDAARLAVVLNHGKALPVKCFAMVILEFLHRNRAAIVHTGDKTGTIYSKGYIILCIRTEISVFI